MASSNPDLQSTVEQLERVSEQARGTITEFSSAAVEKLEQSRGPAAAGLERAAENLHWQADQLPGGEGVAELAHATADKLSETARYVRRHTLNDMMTDVVNLARQYPGPALVFAASIGFLTARAFSGSGRK